MNKEQLKTKKITLSTLKSFINKSEVLYVEVSSSFNGMTDCVERVEEKLRCLYT